MGNVGKMKMSNGYSKYIELQHWNVHIVSSFFPCSGVDDDRVWLMRVQEI